MISRKIVAMVDLPSLPPPGPTRGKAQEDFFSQLRQEIGEDQGVL